MSANPQAAASIPEADVATLSDSELIQLICQGSNQALLHLIVDRCGGVIRSVAKAYRYDGDLLQEIFVLLLGERGDWAKLSTFQGTSAIEGWLRRVAQRICLTQYREKKKHRERFTRLPDEGDQIPASTNWSLMCGLDQEETRTQLLRSIDELEDRDRAIILLHCLGDPQKTSGEMMALLQISAGAFRTAKLRAIERLGEILKKEGNDHV